MPTHIIDTDVPLPTDWECAGLKGKGIYPHCLIAPGESFVTATTGHLRQIVHKHAKASGKRFVIRREGAGYRCWRVS